MRTKQKNRIRKSTKYIGTIISIVLLVTSFTSLMKNVSNENIKTRTKEIYNYTNKFHYDYHVNLLDNPYIKQDEEKDESIVYVTDLIDTTDVTLNYEYVADKESSLTYTYSIIGKLQVVYTRDGEEQKIIDEEEIILEKQTKEISGNTININETLNLDLKDKNNLLKEFEQELGMSISTKYTVILKVRVQTDIEEDPIDVSYEPTIQIDLGEKTTKIIGENNKEDKQFISNEYQVNGARNIVIIILDIIIIIISIGVLRYMVKAKATNRVKNEFRQELNRILKICQDKIVQISSKPHDPPENIVYVKDFGEIFKVSEELFKPILYYFDNEKQEAWFSVMTGGTTYRYILKG